MAEVTGLRNNALPYPCYNFPWGVVFSILDNTGALVSGAAGLDSEVSKNGDTFADCTNEATEIATSSGMYYLLLTSAEMTADVVSVIVKTSTTDAKTTPMVFYPRKLTLIDSNTAAGGTTAKIQLAVGSSGVHNFYKGVVVLAEIDSNFEARVIDSYDESAREAFVTPAWNVAPDSSDPYYLYLPDGVYLTQANTTAIDGTNGAADTIWDEAVDGSVTARQSLRLNNSAAGAKLSGAATTTVVVRDLADSKDRVTATVDASGNRTAVTRDLT